MKACPACNTRYEDAVTFCSKDGTAVIQDSSSAGQASIGQVIGDRYRLIKKIGEGGMGEVYIAEHIHIEKRVALKLLRPEILQNQEAVARFRQEARSASSIGHENIIQIDDFGTLPDGRVYLAMEFLDGKPLNDIIAKEILPLGRSLNILIQTGRALAAAHAKGIVHRDMKPENIFIVQKDGREIPKLLDFGIAKVSGGDNPQKTLTVAGTIFGTPFYMAPEQAMGQKIDHRADIYAMGVILFEMFVGYVPFKAETFMGILTQHITSPPPPPMQSAAANGRQIPPEMEWVILKCLGKTPPERFQSMNELVAALIDIYRKYVGPAESGPMAAMPMRPSQGMDVVMSQTASGMRVPTVPPGTGGKGKMIAGIVAVGLVLGGGGIGIYVATRDQKKVVVNATPDAGAAGKVIGKEPVKEPVKVAVADAAPPVKIAQGTPDAGKAAEPPPPPPPQSIHVLVDSEPGKAAVYRENTKIDTTPASVDVTAGQVVNLTLRLEGYVDEALQIDGSKPKVITRLTKTKRTPTTPTTPVTHPELKTPEEIKDPFKQGGGY